MSTDTQLTTRKVRADAGQRAQQAWALRVAGREWAEVAKATGFTDPANCIRAVRTYFGTLPQPDREELRTLARARGERLWEQALVDVLQQRPGAVRAAVALLQRQSALDGLDQPSRVHVDVTDSDLGELVAELSAMLGTSAAEVDPLELTEVVEDD